MHEAEWHIFCHLVEKRSMKYIFYSLLMLGLIWTAGAQNKQKANAGKGKKTAEERAEKFTGNLSTELNLTEDQKPKVKELVHARITEVKTIKAKYPNDPKAAKAELKPVKQKFREDLKALLDEEQKKKFDTYVERKKQERKQKKQKPGEEDEESDLIGE